MKVIERDFNLRIIDYFLDIIGKWYCNIKCKKEYINSKFRWINERPIEYHFVFQTLTTIYIKTVLDIGTGTTALPHLIRNCGYLVTAIDIYDYWPSGIFNRHYYIIRDDITNSKLKMKFDCITCISVLEHIKNFNAAVENMVNLLNEKGYLILTFPYNEEKYIENVYKLPGAGYGQNNPQICQVFSRDELNNWLNVYNIKIIQQEYWQVFEGEYWTFGKHINPPHRVGKEEKHQLSCILIQKQ